MYTGSKYKMYETAFCSFKMIVHATITWFGLLKNDWLSAVLFQNI